MTITLTGLTPQQSKLADMIWSCDSQQDVERFMQALPPEYKRDAETVHQLMIAAVFDEHTEIHADVQDLISRVSRS